MECAVHLHSEKRQYTDISRFNLAVCSWNLMVLFKNLIFEWSKWMALKVRCIFQWQVRDQMSNGG